MSETNVCTYCGQVGFGPCDCGDAKRERVRREYLERANEEIEKLLTGEDGVSLADKATVDLLKSIAEHVSYRCLQSAKFVLVSGIAITMKRVSLFLLQAVKYDVRREAV